MARDQGLTDGFGRDPRVGERGRGGGIALRLRFDEVAEIVSELGAVFFSSVSSAIGEAIAAGEAGAQFVESELDGLSSPAEDAFGLTGAAVEVIGGDLGLEASPFGSGQEPGGVANGLEHLFREGFHRAPKLVKVRG